MHTHFTKSTIFNQLAAKDAGDLISSIDCKNGAFIPSNTWFMFKLTRRDVNNDGFILCTFVYFFCLYNFLLFLGDVYICLFFKEKKKEIRVKEYTRHIRVKPNLRNLNRHHLSFALRIPNLPSFHVQHTKIYKHF